MHLNLILHDKILQMIKPNKKIILFFVLDIDKIDENWKLSSENEK